MAVSVRSFIFLWCITALVAGCGAGDRSAGDAGPGIEFRYDSEGRLSELRGPGKHRESVEYDSRGLPVTIRANELERHFEYDANRMFSGFVDDSGRTVIEFDRFGRLTGTRHPGGQMLRYEYDDLGLRAVNLDDHFELRYQRDLFGSVTSAETPAGDFHFDIDYSGRIMQRRYPNGAFSVFEWNTAGRVIRIQHAGPDRHLLMKFEYEYDDLARLRRITELGRNGDVTRIELTYDEYGQLQEAEYSDGRFYRYSYDIRGNRTEVSTNAGSTSASYDEFDRLTAWNTQPASHDALGNLVAVGNRNHRFDARGRLVDDDHRSYQYNALGFRIGESSSEGDRSFVHLLDGLPRLLAEEGPEQRHYLWADSMLLGHVTEDDVAVYYFEDHLGSIRGAIDANGRWLGRAEFSPFGIPIARIAGVRHGFTGEEQDEAGYVFLRARYYSPLIGRFIARDPGPLAMTGLGKQNDYAYVGNAVHNYVDRNGAEREPVRSPVGPVLRFPPKSDAEFLWDLASALVGGLADKFIVPEPLDYSADWRQKYEHRGYWKSCDRCYTPRYDEVMAFLDEFERRTPASQLHRYSLLPGVEQDIWPRTWKNVSKVRRPDGTIEDMDWRAANRFLPRNPYIAATVIVVRTPVEMVYLGAKFTAAPGYLNTYNSLVEGVPVTEWPPYLHRFTPGYISNQYDNVIQNWSGKLSGLDDYTSSLAREEDVFRSPRLRDLAVNDVDDDDYADIDPFGDPDITMPDGGSGTGPDDGFLGNDDDNYDDDSDDPVGDMDDGSVDSGDDSGPDDGSDEGPGGGGGGGGGGDDPGDGGSGGGGPRCPGAPGCGDGGGPGGPGGPGGSGGPGGGPGGPRYQDSSSNLQWTRPPDPLQTPNVGGVYLDAVAEVVGDLASLDGATLDLENGRLLLTGRDGTTADMPPVRLDDLAAAYSAVFGENSVAPAVTIDPNPDNPRAEQMLVRFFGGVENTNFGMVLFESDRVMKALSLGEDNLTGEVASVNVDGFYPLPELAFSNLAGSHDDELWSRFWLVPDQVIVMLSDDGRSVTFPDTRIRVKTETMRWQRGELVPAEGQRDEQAEYFAAHFTQHYDEYAEQHPVFAQLKTLVNFIALLEWLKRTGGPDMYWLTRYLSAEPTPETTPSLTVSREGGQRIVSVFGGTDTAFEPIFVEDTDSSASRSAHLARRSVEDRPGVLSTSIEGQDGPLRLITLPTGQVRASRPRIVRERELDLVSRLYSSADDLHGEFGHSWRIDLPRLQIWRPRKGEDGYITFDGVATPDRRFALRTPLGTGDVTFRDVTFDQELQRIAFTPDYSDEIRALYPNVDGTYRMERLAGDALVFDDTGRLIRHEQSAGDNIAYAYNAESQLVEATRTGPDPGSLSLRYDDEGRVREATVSGEIIRYEYDADGNLARVAGAVPTIEYRYDDEHRVRGVSVDGETIAEPAYDENGNALTSGESETMVAYDALGRVIEIVAKSGDRTTFRYHPSGEIAGRVVQDAHGARLETTYSPDGRSVYVTDGTGWSASATLDAFGRPIAVQEDGRLVWQGAYRRVLSPSPANEQSTESRWLVDGQTEAIAFRSFFDDRGRVIETTLTTANPRGGYLRANYGYDAATLSAIEIEGLVSGEWRLTDGKPVYWRYGDDETIAEYSDSRLTRVASDDGEVSVSYDESGFSEFSIRIGDMIGLQKYREGRLVQRTNSNGVADDLYYDEQGRFIRIERADGDRWSIQRDATSISVLRGDTPRLQLRFDEDGRLTQLQY